MYVSSYFIINYFIICTIKLPEALREMGLFEGGLEKHPCFKE